MPAAARLALFAVALAAVATAATLLGRASGVSVAEAAEEGHGAAEGPGARPNGLSDVAGGVRLLLAPTTLAAGVPARIELRLVGDDGEPVTELDETHGEPPLHLILVRRDLTGYLHLHPERVGERFVADVTLMEPGVWRAYADFERDGEKVVLGRDLVVPGAFAPRALAAPDDVAAVGGYRIALAAGDLRAGAEARVTFRLTRDGEPVVPEPYLGASGHLVAVREDDLAYLHVHPVESPAGSTVAFDAELAEPGRYALFLQFRDEGAVRTARFTVEVRR
ncbi:MAG TPA: hypothetical protein VFO81_01620 [Gaiellaceae bacterium]|nr:hypothetical protein [Gaiellaceae bacterium]